MEVGPSALAAPHSRSINEVRTTPRIALLSALTAQLPPDCAWLACDFHLSCLPRVCARHRESPGVRPESLDDSDRWRIEQVKGRYRDYCRRHGIEPQDLIIGGLYLERRWTAGALDALTERMKRGDLAAAEIGIEMMEEDRGLAFGSIVKSNLPRALARCALTESQQDRVRRRVADMLLRKFLPKEFREYAWLARRLGMDRWREPLEEKADRADPWVDWYLRYLLEKSPPRPPERVWL